jgi:hypothetical protein
MLSSFVCRDIDELREIIKHSQGIVFEPLFRQITKESLGQADTNTCHDWRKEPQGPK